MKHNSGVSLIIAMIFVAAFMFVMAGLFEAQMKTLQNMRNRELSANARLLKESAKNYAQWLAGRNGTGWNKDPNDQNYQVVMAVLGNLWEDGRTSGAPDCDVENPCAGFNVVGRSTEQVKMKGVSYYSVPLVTKDENGNTIGTGTASEKCVNAADANDPCNWNKIRVGQAVDIPLYYIDANGAVSDHDFTAPNMEFYLRVRAPCNNYARDCDPADRIVLFPGTDKQGYRDIKIDPVLMQWMVSDADGGKSVLIARDNTAGWPNDNLRKIFKYDDQNTELSAGRINLANITEAEDPLDNFIVLQYLSSGSIDDKHYGKNMDNTKQWLGNFITSLPKPILRLNLVTQPEKEDLNRNGPYTHQNDMSYYVPYLEYQLLTTLPVSDSKSYLTGWAKIGEFRKDFSAVRETTPSLGGFVLGNL